MPPILVAARAVLADADTWLADGGVLIERGRVAKLLASRGAVRRASAGARVIELDELVLTPGLINAHAHLDLSGLAGATPRGGDFRAWVRAVIRLRAARTPRELARDARRGAQRCLETGTTAIGDIDATGASERAFDPDGPRLWLYREALDAQDERRTDAALARVSTRLAARSRRVEGLAPHAPFSVGPRLFAALGELARRRSLPVTIHWAETRDEVTWLRDGSGPLAELLGPSPRRTGLDLIRRAGLLRAPLSLVHGNFPERGDAEALARAGAVLVHCPGSHAWFAREPFPREHFESRGVSVALGTDSLASNDDLDLRREMRRVRESEPSLAPERVWNMATRNGALALGARGRLGELCAGAHADCVAHRMRARSRRAALEELTLGATEIAGIWIAGRRAGSFSARN